MWWRGLFVRLSLTVLLFSCSWAAAGCPSADLSGDCFVDYEDFTLISGHWFNAFDCNDLAEMASQWLTEGIPPDPPPTMVYIPGGEFEMGDHFAPEGYDDELPVHAVLVDAFFMSRYEITNSQYCDFLNSAYPAQLKVVDDVVYASSDSSNSYPYCDTYNYETGSQIDFSDPNFSVVTKGGRDMSNDPIVVVSWYGAAAYCNWRSGQEGYQACYNLSTWDCDFTKKGYRLATEAEWEYAARGGEHSPYYRFPWGDTISHSQANYIAKPDHFTYDVSPTSGYHPNWNDVWPYTSVVGSFSANGYGLYDMAGNVFEWCNDWYDGSYYDVSPYDNPTGTASGSDLVLRGGGWGYYAGMCRVASRIGYNPVSCGDAFGFRVVLVGINSTRIGHWTMDDSDDNTTVLDSSGYNNNGTAQQNTSVISTAGVIDGALTFDGIGDYVQIADSDALSPTEEITVCGWFYFDDASGNVGLIWKHSYNYVLSTPADTVRFSVWNPSSQESRASFSTLLLETGWNFIAGVFDGTNSRLYLNGAPTGSIGASLTGGIRDRVGDLYIGQRPDGVGEQYFDGNIDDVRIYGQALTPTEIMSLYNLMP